MTVNPGISRQSANVIVVYTRAFAIVRELRRCLRLGSAPDVIENKPVCLHRCNSATSLYAAEAI